MSTTSNSSIYNNNSIYNNKNDNNNKIYNKVQAEKYFMNALNKYTTLKYYSDKHYAILYLLVYLDQYSGRGLRHINDLYSKAELDKTVQMLKKCVEIYKIEKNKENKGK